MTDFALTITSSPIDVALDASPIDVALAVPGPQGPPGSGGGSLSDGDKGDITVSGTGSVWTVDDDAITYAKLQNVSAASRLIGRGSLGGAGDPQEITLGAGLAMSGTSVIVAPGTAGIVAEDVEFSPSGSLAATDVQTALEELDSEKVATSQLSTTPAVSKVVQANGSGKVDPAWLDVFTTLRMYDAGQDYVVEVAIGDGLAANGALNILLGGASRNLTISANADISGTNTGDQTSVSGNAGTVTVADAGGDATCWPMLATSQTGSLAPATDAGLTYNAATNAIAATTFSGQLDGTISSATTATTQSANDNSTKPATTAYADLADSHQARPFILNASGGRVTLTNQATGAQFFGNTYSNIGQYDLTHVTHARLVAHVYTASASANTPKLRAVYRTSYGTPIISEYSADLGTSEISCSMAAAGMIVSSWIALASGAKADVFLTVEQSGGDTVADPALGLVYIDFKGHA